MCDEHSENYETSQRVGFVDRNVNNEVTEFCEITHLRCLYEHFGERTEAARSSRCFGVERSLIC